MSDIFKYASILLPLSLSSGQMIASNTTILSKSFVFFAEEDDEENDDDNDDSINNNDEKINDKLKVEGRAEVDLGFNFDANHPKKPNLKPMMISKKKDSENRGLSWDFEADLILKKDFTWSDNVLKFLLDINCNLEDKVTLDTAKVDLNGYYFGYIPSLSLGGKDKYLGLGKIFKPTQNFEIGLSFEKQKEIKEKDGDKENSEVINDIESGYSHNADIPTINLMFKYKFDDNFGNITLANMVRPILLSKKLDKQKQDASGFEKKYDFVFGFNPKLSTQFNFKPDWYIFKADVSFISGTGDYLAIKQLKKKDIPQTLIKKDDISANDENLLPHTSMKYLNANISYEHHWIKDFYTKLSIGDFLCLQDLKKRKEYDGNFKNVIFSNLTLSYKICKFLEMSGTYGFGYKSLQELEDKPQNSNDKDKKDESNFASHFGICLEATLSND